MSDKLIYSTTLVSPGSGSAWQIYGHIVPLSGRIKIVSTVSCSYNTNTDTKYGITSAGTDLRYLNGGNGHSVATGIISGLPSGLSTSLSGSFWVYASYSLRGLNIAVYEA